MSISCKYVKMTGTSKNPMGRRSGGRGLQKTTCNSLIKPLLSGKTIKSGTLKTSKARFLEFPGAISRVWSLETWTIS
jgi:hypothetical protein